MFIRALLAAGLACAIVVGNAIAAEKTVKSGPQVGEELAGPFHPLNINGKMASQKYCLYCENGQAPVAMVFARDMSPALEKLIKSLDDAAQKNADYSMGSFVVFCNDDKDLEGKLKEVAEKNSLKKVILAIDNPSGPKGYKVAKESDVTVVLYREHTVKANHAFAKGQLDDKAISTIVADLPKILSTK
jgi:hypothetical protein